MTQTENARGRITAEKLDELWEEFEASAKPTGFDGDMEFFNVEDMQDQAYYLYEAAKSLLAPTPQDAVKVKPLVWEDFDERGAKASAFYNANYLINLWNGRGQFEVSFSYPGYQTGYDGERWHDTLEAAKADAQADYETRIRSALEPCDPQDDPRVTALVDALRNACEELEQAELSQVAAKNTTLARLSAEARDAGLAALAAFDTTGGKADE